jgi:hypothetical protein
VIFGYQNAQFISRNVRINALVSSPGGLSGLQILKMLQGIAVQFRLWSVFICPSFLVFTKII